jgi:Ca-activated chloride channel family protein
VKLGFPHALWLLAAAPVLVALALREHRQRRERLARLGDLGLLRSLSLGAEGARRLWLRFVAIALWCVLAFALAGPKWGERTELLPRRGLDVVFAVDVSRSMRARDVLPDRLERAKAEIGLVLDEVKEHRVGLVVFAGTAFVQCPLTTDVEAARAFLRAIDNATVPQGGTALSAGLFTAHNLFHAEVEADPAAAQAGRLLVVITDGEDHEGEVESAADALKELGVELLVIGVGQRLGEPIPLVDEDDGRVLGYKKDRKGDTVMTRLNPEMLQMVAERAGGSFVEGSSKPDLGMSEVLARIGRLEKRDFEARLQRFDIDRSAWPLGAALILWVLAAFVRERPRSARRQRLPVVAVAITVGLFAGGAAAEEEAGLFERTEPNLESGFDAVRRGAYGEAIERFRRAEVESSEDRAVVEYDVGQALSAQAEAEVAEAREGLVPGAPDPATAPDADAPGADLWQQATESFERAYGFAESPSLRSEAALAAGNALARAGELDRAVDAFRRSVVANPMNERARTNLATTLRTLRAQPPPPPQQGENDDEQEQEEGDEQQQQQEGEQEQQQDGEQEQQEQQDGEQEQQDGEQEQQDGEQQQQDGEQQQQPGEEPERGDEQQQQPGDEKDKGEDKPSDPSQPKDGEGDEKKEAPAPGEEKEEEDEDKARARRLLDAMRKRERPLAPHLMNEQRRRPRAAEKDW